METSRLVKILPFKCLSVSVAIAEGLLLVSKNIFPTPTILFLSLREAEMRCRECGLKKETRSVLRHFMA
jgi:hypothetical protein